MKICLIVFLIIIHNGLALSQQGLEGIIVEKYYVSDLNDEKFSEGALKRGSVTYRIFVDMRPGYLFEAAYGVTEHPMKISTSTYFYNDVKSGAVIANDISNKRLSNGTLMLDSWLSVCAGSSANFAILKSTDTTDAIKNNDHVLENADSLAGIPIKIRDGLRYWTSSPRVTFFGFNDSLNSFFKTINPSAKGQVFTSDDASWAKFGGSSGLDSTNIVLIAQITTNGQFSFELNIQIGTEGGKIENYVAKNPSGNEIQFPGLIYTVPVTNSILENRSRIK